MNNPKEILKKQLDAVVWGNITAVEPVIETWFVCAKASDVDEASLRDVLSSIKLKKHKSVERSIKAFENKLDEDKKNKA